MGPVLGDLLRAVAQRLTTAKMSTFVVVCRHYYEWTVVDGQSLVLPFAYLFGTDHTTQVIDLLSSFSLPTSDGSEKSGLDIVLSAWCEHCDTFAGSWDIRVR